MANKEAPELHTSPRTQHTLEPERTHTAQTEHEASLVLLLYGALSGALWQCQRPAEAGCRSPSGDNSHGGQGGGGQHPHDRLPIPAKAP